MGHTCVQYTVIGRNSKVRNLIKRSRGRKERLNTKTKLVYILILNLLKLTIIQYTLQYGIVKKTNCTKLKETEVITSTERQK